MAGLYIFMDLEGNNHEFADIKEAFEFKEQYNLKHGLKNDLDHFFAKDETPQTYIYPSNIHKQRKKRLRRKKEINQ